MSVMGAPGAGLFFLLYFFVGLPAVSIYLLLVKEVRGSFLKLNACIFALFAYSLFQASLFTIKNGEISGFRLVMLYVSCLVFINILLAVVAVLFKRAAIYKIWWVVFFYFTLLTSILFMLWALVF